MKNPCLRKKIHIRHSEGFFEGAKPFLIHLGSKLMYCIYRCDHVILLFISLLILLFLSLLMLLVLYSSSSYIFLSSYTSVVLQTEKTPRKFQFGKKSVKVYHCLYSSIKQLQVALWTYIFLRKLFNIEQSIHTPPLNLPISYLSISNPSLLKPSVSSPWSIWWVKHKE